MEQIPQIGDADDDGQRADDGGSVDRDHVAHQAEYTNRGNLDDHHHDLHDDLAHAVDQFRNFFSLFTGSKNARSGKQGDHDDREHIRSHHRLECVAWKNPHDDIHHVRAGRRIFRSARFQTGKCSNKGVG